MSKNAITIGNSVVKDKVFTHFLPILSDRYPPNIVPTLPPNKEEVRNIPPVVNGYPILLKYSGKKLLKVAIIPVLKITIKDINITYLKFFSFKNPKWLP